MAKFIYKAFGSLVRSDIEIPEFYPIEGSFSKGPISNDLIGAPIDIVLGEVPKFLQGTVPTDPWLFHADGRFLLSVPEIGCLLIEHGHRITVQFSDEARGNDLRAYILGTGFGALLHQRGLVPLHVSALQSPVGAIAFTGPSGAGKSTAAAKLHSELGWPIISDDLAVLLVRADDVQLVGGVRRLRLWSDAMERLNWSTAGLARDLHRRNKFLVQDHTPFVEDVQDLVALYEIDNASDAADATPLRGAQSFQILMNAIYRPTIAKETHTVEGLNSLITKTCKKISCFKGPRPSAKHVASVLGSIM